TAWRVALPEIPFVSPTPASPTQGRLSPPPRCRRPPPPGSQWQQPGLALNVRKLLRDFAITDAEDVDAADMAGLAVGVGPVVDPAHGAAIAAGEDVLGVEAGVR